MDAGVKLFESFIQKKKLFESNLVIFEIRLHQKNHASLFFCLPCIPFIISTEYKNKDLNFKIIIFYWRKDRHSRACISALFIANVLKL